jgi:hypothetical protein
MQASDILEYILLQEIDSAGHTYIVYTNDTSAGDLRIDSLLTYNPVA